MHRNNGFSTCWSEIDFRFRYKFDFEGQIYKKRHQVFAVKIEVLISRANCLKKLKRSFSQNFMKCSPPPQGPKALPRGASSPGGPKISPRPLRDTNSIYSNSRSTAKPPLLIVLTYIYIYMHLYVSMHDHA